MRRDFLKNGEKNKYSTLLIGNQKFDSQMIKVQIRKKEKSSSGGDVGKELILIKFNQLQFKLTF